MGDDLPLACARILRAEAERLGYTSRFTIYDEADSLRVVRRCLEELSIDPKRFTPRAIKSQISAAKNRLEDAAAYRERVGSFFEQTVADVYELYEQRIHEMNALDFDDLLFRTVNVLELFPDVAERYRQTFRWILVDEYQDTNHAQYRLLQLLAGEQRNVCVVGDDDQSIYSWRGADIANILDFERDFPGAQGREAGAELPLHADDPRRPPTRSSRTTRGASPRSCGATTAAASRCTSPSSTTSTRRRATSRPRSSGSREEEGISRRTSPSSTGPTRRAACSRTRWCGSTSPTR